ncbi:RsmB/NOP family class I SAM-dependent RNA methyltransferase [Ovoidimarina sediminis]|uniref:RsmB/NOP family class I SAM-dependent RNA methyltransferase n=1 Tax=Ovoidimarina sediminis TaxID=3079856 RepID=UPI0029072ADB|nr:transcription antitermination factor NusB [Rhodophyticola sp. MJ-SS7]MDU8943832.1 transcription antitermination factor NusB [Rhodophyticola sp. MJ-SS7]
MAQDALAARRAAWRMISAAMADGRLFSETAPKLLEPLAPPDRARAQRLATETLRWAGRADRVLGPYLRQKPEPALHGLLRLGVWEICTDGAAPYGVVDALVTILKETGVPKGQTGFVNAVLRRVGKGRVVWEDLPIPELPRWLRNPLLADYGKAVIAGIERAHAAGAPLDITPARAAPADLAERLGATPLPTGGLRLTDPGQVSRLPGYADGHWWIQDAAASLPARCLAPAEGARVLDLCAAPGGKTMQLADAGAAVTALDISESRMTRLRENLARTGLSANLVVADAFDWAPDAPFDAILLDAPCTATGTIRRHPDLPHAKDSADFAALFELQARLIDRAFGWLRPGGRMVYCTCSLLFDEGEEQITDALARHPGLAVDADATRIEGVDAGWHTPEGGLRLRPDYWPDRGGMDGFYIAVLQKPA